MEVREFSSYGKELVSVMLMASWIMSTTINEWGVLQHGYRKTAKEWCCVMSKLVEAEEKKSVGCGSGRQENCGSGRRECGRIRTWDPGIKRAATFQAQFKALRADLQSSLGQLQGRPGGHGDHRLITDWEWFKESIQNRFGPSKYEDPQGTLSKLLNSIPLRSTSVMAKPTMLGEAFSLARVTEARLDDQASSMFVTATKPVTSFEGPRQTNPYFGLPSNQVTGAKLALLPTSTQTNSNTNSKPLAIKCISLVERQERLKKGLCFNCDNKWT
ncbi:hypothetical protein Tco_1233264 [Tanacetum coccineum]